MKISIINKGAEEFNLEGALKIIDENWDLRKLQLLEMKKKLKELINKHNSGRTREYCHLYTA